MTCVFSSWYETGDVSERKYLLDFVTSLNVLFPVLANRNLFANKSVYDGVLGQRRQTVPAFQVGDEVRITKAKGTFQKGYEQNWTEEVFKVARVNTVLSPSMYSLVEEDGTPIKGTFYAQELQKVEVRERDVYRIEVIRTRGRGHNKEFLVKWAGWPDKYNSWIRASTIQSSTNV